MDSDINYAFETYSGLLYYLSERQTEECQELLKQEEESEEYRILSFYKQINELLQVARDKDRKLQEAARAFEQKILPSYNPNPRYTGSSSLLMLQQTETLLRAALDPSFSDEIKGLLDARTQAQSEVVEASKARKQAHVELDSKISACGGEKSVCEKIENRCRVVRDILFPDEDNSVHA